MQFQSNTLGFSEMCTRNQMERIAKNRTHQFLSSPQKARRLKLKYKVTNSKFDRDEH